MVASTSRRPRDAARTREAILDAAEAIFAEHGFDGARIDAIASRAGCNKSLIFQYFTDKLNLYGEVIRRADSQTRELQAPALELVLDVEPPSNRRRARAVLEEWLGAYFDYLVSHPNVVRIYLWELAEGWQTLSMVLTESDYRDVGAFDLVLRDLQRAGVLRQDRSPTDQIVTAVFLGPFLLGLAPLCRTLRPDADEPSEVAMPGDREYFVELVLHALMVDSTDQIDEGAQWRQEES